MTDNTTVDISDDLDAFSKDFFNPTAAAEAEEVVETVEEDEDADTDENPVANEEDTDAEDETDDEASEEEPDEDESDEEDKDPEEDKPHKGKKNRKSARERIEELVTEARVAQREADALRRRIEQLEASTPRKEDVHEDEKPVALRDQLSADAPNPDALNEKGEAIYPLGEFDPTYIRDLTKFTIAQERKAIQEQEAQERAAKEIAEAQTELQQNWAANLEKVKEDLPDIQEKIADLEPVVKDIDPQYGDFLAATIMASDFGPQIMYYLAENIDEAQSIVASGPASATRAIGRLEARFETSANRTEKQRNTNKRVSDAPPPPEARTKGNRGTSHVRPDTDDLDAFSREFFGKK